MWGFIITLIVLFIGKFIYDTAKQSSKIKSDGGIRRKYATLVDHFLSGHPNCRIFQETNTFVSVGVSGAGGSQVYYIYPSYGNVSIRMEIKNNPLLGNLKKEWTFPENMDQEDMIFKMNADIEEMMNNFAKKFE
jgi:glutamine phosphoribosylpyrophosphate amidotransferase